MPSVNCVAGLGGDAAGAILLGGPDEKLATIRQVKRDLAMFCHSQGPLLDRKVMKMFFELHLRLS